MAPNGTAATSPDQIPGPSAVGQTWRRFWDLLWLTATEEYRRRYAHSALGYLWTLLRPLLLFGALYVVVVEIRFRFNGTIKDYGVLLLTNIVLFQFFVEGTNRSIRSLARRADLMTRMSIPRLVMPLSAVLAVLFTLGSNLAVVFVWVLLYPIHPMWTWLLLPVLLIPLVVLTVSVGLLLSTLFVRYRDVGEVWPIISRVLFYTSPVIVPLEIMPKALFDAQSFNPLAPIIVQARPWLIDPSAPGWFDSGKTVFAELMPFVLFVVICVAGVVAFMRRSKRVAEEL
jgi:ABC-2 type transport system permease protein